MPLPMTLSEILVITIVTGMVLWGVLTAISVIGYALNKKNRQIINYENRN